MNLKSVVQKSILFVLSFVIFSCKDLGEKTDDTGWNNIRDCVMSVAVDYQTNMVVLDVSDVEVVFNKYIAYAKANNRSIFSGYNNNWRFDTASKHGLHNGVKYWSVSAMWLSEQDNQWRTKNVFDVSEEGKVVRLLGCI